MLKRAVQGFSVATCALLLAACVQGGVKTNVTSGGGPSMGEAQAEAYNGPKARIAVARFEDKTGSASRWWNPQLGDGMADQLLTALFQSNRFIVVERGEGINDVLAEQDFGASGRVRQDSAAQIGQIEGAELLVVAAVTELSGNTGGTSGNIRTGNRALDVAGALFGGRQSSHIAIDLRIVDANTSRILAATSVEGEATDWNVGGSALRYGANVDLGGALSSWKNTPLEKALRAVINEAVNYVVTQTPQRFYRHGGSGMSSSSSASMGGASNMDVSAGQWVRITANSLNVRSGPGSANQVLYSLAGGDEVEVIGQSNGWLNVRDGAGRTGWVSASYAQVVQ
jgi:curli biogenesis system outer membrane secretion channel CsgG